MKWYSTLLSASLFAALALAQGTQKPIGAIGDVFLSIAQSSGDTGRQYEQQGNWVAATKAYEDAISYATSALTPYNATGYLVLGSAHLDHLRMLVARGVQNPDDRDLVAAENAFQQGLSVDQAKPVPYRISPILYSRLAAVHLIRGNLDQARTDYLNALQALPTYEPARNGLAYVEYIQGRQPVSVLTSRGLPPPSSPRPPILDRARVVKYGMEIIKLVIPKWGNLLGMVAEDAQKLLAGSQ